VSELYAGPNYLKKCGSYSTRQSFSPSYSCPAVCLQ